jgi:hypothetical protein
MYVILRRMREGYAGQSPWFVGDDRVFLDWDQAKKIEELLENNDNALLKAWEYAVHAIKD